MNDLNNVPIFILTYGRAEKQLTLKTLKKYSITDNVHLVVSDDDPQLNLYKAKYSNLLKIFNREDVQDDMMDNLEQKSGVISARNYCFELAKRLNSKYFIMLDDDYTAFSFRYVKDGKLREKAVTNLKTLFNLSLNFLSQTKLDVFCWAQGGDFIGGVESALVKNGFARKAMNIYFWKTTSEIRFPGRINEDTNMYVHYGKQGKLMLTNSFAMIHQLKTQENEHGMSDLYKDNGTYLKSMYSVIEEPAIVSLTAMGVAHLRIHHKVSWNACTPKVISQQHKKI